MTTKLSLLVPLLLACFFAPAGAQVLDQLVPVPAERVRVDGLFWGPRMAASRATTLPALLDCVEKRGYLTNYDLAAKQARGGHVGGPEADAIVYAVIEATARELLLDKDDGLQARVAAWIPRIKKGQEKDGYLQTYIAVERPGARFDELRTGRELFCLARLIDAAIAWERATGDAALTEIAVRAAGRLEVAVWDAGLVDPPGRPAVERALAMLFQHTGREDWLWLGHDVLGLRGVAEDRKLFGAEVQDMLPVRQQMNAEGDALGQLGLYRGMLEVYGATGDYALMAAVLNGWKDLTEARMYASGGVGLEPDGLLPEPGALPNGRARCEPAAAVELVLLARRLLSLTRQPAFADLEEQVLYNALAIGASPGGDGLLPGCPLEAPGGLERSTELGHPRTAAALSAFLPRLAEGAVLHDEDEIFVAHYIDGEAELVLPGGAVRVVQETRFPWDGEVKLRVIPEKPMKLMIHARVPAWVGDRLEAGVDDAMSVVTVDRGDQAGMWLSWERIWTGKETITLNLPMDPRRIEGGSANPGRVALARGPLLYALEGVDNEGRARSLALPPEATVEEVWEPGLAGGGTILRADGLAALSRDERAKLKNGVATAATRLTAVPYALAANRGLTPLAVWIPEAGADAVAPGEVVERVDDLVLRASQCHRLDSLAALIDGEVPARSNDMVTPRMSFRPQVGGKAWIEIELPKETALSALRVYWADDKSRSAGSVATPRSWKLLRRGPQGWTPVKPAEGEHFWTTIDQLREIPLEGPFTTTALRLELELRADRSAGLYEVELVTL